MIDRLRSLLPGVALDAAVTPDGQTTVLVPADAIVDVCRTLRDQAGLFFLVDITAVDFWPKEPRFLVVYQLASGTERLRLQLKLSGDRARVSTVQSIWPGANWLEREVWDMFGIDFEGHGDLRRLLMPDDWDGHPLRKDYPVQLRLRPRSSEPLQVSEEEFRANLTRDRNERRTDQAR